MALAARQLGETFAAEVEQVNLTAMDDAAVDEIRQLLAQYGVLLFRDLSLSEEELVAVSRRFGDLEIHVRKEYLSPENPEILYVSNIKEEGTGRPIGILSTTEVGWHYDQIYLPKPAVGSFLCADILPSDGGETSFADMSTAYEELPEALRAGIEGRNAVQSYEAFNRSFSVPTNKNQKRQTPDVEHPIVRTHPLTGRKALYLCPGMTTRIVGLPEDESDALLQELFEWTVRPRYVYTHQWRPGDGLLWDNACTMHRREPFDTGEQRLMKRTTILPPPEVAVPF